MGFCIPTSETSSVVQFLNIFLALKSTRFESVILNILPEFHGLTEALECDITLTQL